MDFKNIRLSTDGGVATLTLARPERLNAFTAEMHAEIRAALDRLEVAIIYLRPQVPPVAKPHWAEREFSVISKYIPHNVLIPMYFQDSDSGNKSGTVFEGFANHSEAANGRGRSMDGVAITTSHHRSLKWNRARMLLRSAVV